MSETVDKKYLMLKYSEVFKKLGELKGHVFMLQLEKDERIVGRAGKMGVLLEDISDLLMFGGK